MSSNIETLGPKHRDGHRYATVTSYDVEYRVKVVTVNGGKQTYVYIAGGDFPVFKEVGFLLKQGVGRYQYYNANEAGQISAGYADQGTLAHFVASLVHQFVGAHEYAKSEAAKTPEQVAEEQAVREAAHNARRNARIVKEAEALLATLDALVPATTVHYAVEDARKALRVLAAQASKGNGIKTADPVKA